jgi:hypothetical protein
MFILSRMQPPILPDKDPLDYTVLTYAWVIFLSMFGGVANFIVKMKEGKVRAFNITELIGDLFISAFAGIITFYLCQAAGFGNTLTAALVGISGHMGGRAIHMFERFMENLVGSR